MAVSHDSQACCFTSAGLISTAQREAFFRQQALTLWFTGLSGAGKSTLVRALEERLFDQGRAVYVLDGDNLRAGLNQDLGFSRVDRQENIRRVAHVARLFNDAGLIVLTALIAPYQADREQARQIIGPARFREVFVDSPLQVCIQRDPKGLYRRAQAGEIAQFTGISAPYEVPGQPDLRLDTAQNSVATCLEQLWQHFFASQGGKRSHDDATHTQLQPDASPTTGG